MMGGTVGYPKNNGPTFRVRHRFAASRVKAASIDGNARENCRVAAVPDLRRVLSEVNFREMYTPSTTIRVLRNIFLDDRYCV